ncbi:uncharacterized protein LOC117643436 [Thrips palmi]|uniref:Uncharacterized protein LOC117643436 n=1 Tax=Thrips palmi TaxID=161013 RepID=A0A6P8YET6_THRPL|nr:uncharacterized protein LOC117643436 [Thrips palmi]
MYGRRQANMLQMRMAAPGSNAVGYDPPYATLPAHAGLAQRAPAANGNGNANANGNGPPAWQAHAIRLPFPGGTPVQVHLMTTARRSESPQRYDHQQVVIGTQTAYYQQASQQGPLVYQEQPALAALPGLPAHGSPTRGAGPKPGMAFQAERGVPEGAASSSPALYDASASHASIQKDLTYNSVSIIVPLLMKDCVDFFIYIYSAKDSKIPALLSRITPYGSKEKKPLLFY